ncbi:hypothetical protein DVH24_024029 [Malus domestica]|uniref:Uncharacterized protein n=1 Tax=Malus domestica TaxID=3750 RepID=A0A498JHG3_MALDO|nr:hypothetical protein DVH24_024029 [Malus domestica]
MCFFFSICSLYEQELLGVYGILGLRVQLYFGISSPSLNWTCSEFCSYAFPCTDGSDFRDPREPIIILPETGNC